MNIPGRHRIRLRHFIAFALTAALIALPALSGAAEVLKSPRDHRSYEVLVLDNGLKALIISDPRTDKAAASLNVNVGSGGDPRDREGLAHFLEHMLFLGTEKYPEPGAYKDYINAHGGGQNAYTSFDNTNYFFDVDKDFLEPALDRFAQFFIAPLFNEDYVTRERQVVHSEFLSGKQSDGRRIFSATKQALNPKHPYTKFPVGNAETLADRPGDAVREDLIEFYRTHYSAGLMTLAVLGKEPLETLRRWVQEKFSTIPDTGAESLRTDEPLYGNDRLPARLDIVPIKEQRSLSLTFPIPPVAGLYKAKPVSYIAHLLGHEGKGSLLALLKERGWADGLSAGSGFDHANEATFQVSIKLTEAGLERIDDIVSLVFQYLDLIDRRGIKKWVFDETRQLSEIDFRFSESPPPLRYVRSLAASLRVYPPEHVLKGPYLYERFDPGLIREFLRRLTPDNLLITVVASELATDSATARYETPYKLTRLDKEVARRWQSGRIETALALPRPNVFVPEDLVVKPPQDATPVPVRIEHGPGRELWHKQDTTFDTPRADFYVSLRSPVASDMPRHDVLTRLYVAMVNDQLNEFSYPAQLAGLSYSLYKHIRGMTIRVSGYSEKQETLLRRIVSALAQPDLDARKFERLKQELIRNVRNRRENPPYDRALDELRDMLIDPQWSDHAQLEAAQEATPAGLKAFIPRLLGRLEAVMLSHGNVYPEDARRLAVIVEDGLLAHSRPVTVPHGRVVALEPGDRFLRTLDSAHEESASVVYMQGDNRSLDSRARVALVSQMLSPAFFQELRTERQLGYIVFASHMTLMEVPGIALVVQSPDADPLTLSDHMLAFVEKFHGDLKNMDPAEFTRHKAALVSNILEEETSLQERTNRYWNELDREHYRFDLRERIAAAVREVTQDGLAQFYRDLLSGEGRKQITLHASGNRHAESRPAGGSSALAGGVLVDSVEAFKQQRTFFDP